MPLPWPIRDRMEWVEGLGTGLVASKAVTGETVATAETAAWEANLGPCICTGTSCCILWC